MKKDIKEFWAWIKTAADYRPTFLQLAVFAWVVSWFLSFLLIGGK